MKKLFAWFRKTFLGNDLELWEEVELSIRWCHCNQLGITELRDYWPPLARSLLGFSEPSFRTPRTQNHRHEAAVYEAAPQHYATRANCEKQKSIWEPIYSPFSSFFTSNSFSLPLERSRLIPQITSAFRGIVGHKTELKFSCKWWKPEQFPWRKQTLTSGGLSSNLCSWTADITGSHDSFINSQRRSTEIESFSQLFCRHKQNRVR